MKELLPQLFKTEYSKIIAVLCRLFGTSDIQLAEDLTNDTFLSAYEIWPVKGIPDNPAAWLYTVAKNKANDYFRRNKIYNEKVLSYLKYPQSEHEETAIDLSQQHISDSQLQMLFAICHPAISPEALIGMALRILCGFGISEIAEAFLTNKETINKRLHRAKEKLRTENIRIELPAESEINKRLETVLTTLYLLFNEGCYSNTQDKTLRKELCIEAMRLTYMLIENKATNKPVVNALMSLMCFHSSRFEARIDKAGESILYENQNRDLWNDELIAKGNYFLIESAKGQEISKYHLEASIAYWHCTKIERPDKWENILQLYNKLLQIDYSPVAALNRTFALSKAYGKEAAIAEAEKLNLTSNHFYYSLLGYLYEGVDNATSNTHYKAALSLAKTTADKAIILHRIKRLAS